MTPAPKTRRSRSFSKKAVAMASLLPLRWLRPAALVRP
jgi:hypothetical protein